MKVGFVGVGSQGGPMARRIAEHGHETTLWARRPEVLDAFDGCGAARADSLEALASGAEVVCVCVMADGDVREVADRLVPAMAAGSTFVIHSTVHPSTCLDVARQAGPYGVDVLDAPVSGGGPAAAEGRLEVLVGGAAPVVERCRPVFATYSAQVLHLGGLGSGQLAKLINNVVFMAHIAIAEDAFAIGEAFAIERGTLAQVISGGSGKSAAFDILALLGSLERFAEVGADRLRKDVGILAGVLDERGAAPSVAHRVAADCLQSMGADPTERRAGAT